MSRGLARTGQVLDRVWWDALSEINGYPLSSMEEIAIAYEALREQTEFSVAVVRDEATVVLTYRVVDEI